jgi:hypothetical protein
MVAISTSSGGRSGNASRAGSARRVRGEGAGPRGSIASGWKAGQGIEGRVCLGAVRGGRGPCTRRREEGGGRRGMMITLQKRVVIQASEDLTFETNCQQTVINLVSSVENKRE